MQKIGFVIYPGFQVIGLAAATAFEVTNLDHEKPVYDVSIRSIAGGTVTGSSGMAMESAPLGDEHFDTLILCGGMTIPRAPDELLTYLRAAQGSVRRLASICTGAFILADAGLLNGHRATTHWFFARDLERLHPAIKLEQDRIYIADRGVWTSAGMSAGIDMALGMIEEDFSHAAARSVAQKLVLYHRRAGGQSQHSTLLDLAPKTDRVQTALDYARRNLRKPLNVEDLADAARLSPRQFSRIFQSETGKSPAKAVEQLRLETARLMLEQGHSIQEIADETGFADRNRMRRAFLRAFGEPPQFMQRKFADPVQ